MPTPWSVPRLWPGATVAILASGPSMSREVAEAVHGRCRVIAVSNQGIDNKVGGVTVPAFAPWADILYAADRIWWRENPQALRFCGLKVTCRVPGGGDSNEFPELLEIKNGGPSGFDDRPTHVRTCGNSGFQAMHIAAHLGAARILLCGFDMKPASNGKQHWFGEHQFRRGHKSAYATFISRITASAHEFENRGVQVFNCTKGSSLRCFPFASIEEVLTNGLQSVRGYAEAAAEKHPAEA